MPERQVHGNLFEAAVISLNNAKANAYTAAWDIGTNTSVKYIREDGSVDCGDFRRVWEHCLSTAETGESWYMVLGRHINKKCTAVYELEFTPERCLQLMGELPTEEVYNIGDTISTEYWPVGYREEAREVATQWKEEWGQLFGKLSPARKISKTNCRMQCTIGKTNLNSLFGELVQSKKYEKLIGVSFAE
jgi:hypothetical protein